MSVLVYFKDRLYRIISYSCSVIHTRRYENTSVHYKINKTVTRLEIQNHTLKFWKQFFKPESYIDL